MVRPFRVGSGLRNTDGFRFFPRGPFRRGVRRGLLLGRDGPGCARLRFTQPLLGHSFRRHGPSGLSCADEDAEGQRRDDCGSRREAELVPPNRLLKVIEPTRRAGQDWLVAEVVFEIRRQTVGRLVSARPVLFQTFHHDPVQVALELVQQFGGVG